jgi:hypothetical protein
MDPQTQIWLSYGATAIIMAFILRRRFRSMAKEHPLNPDRLWMFPALYALIAGILVFAYPPILMGWLCAGVGLLLGAGLGWQRGKLMKIMINPETKSLTQKASPAAMIFIILIIVARIASRAFVGIESSLGGGMNGPTQLATDALVALALGFISAQRIEMYVRAKRLLASV